ncbi:MAG: AmmeMemoRadiSam system protein B [Anaerolineae bacterium]|nr:AmmeMemoRadiSam system protein B [Thermoflexales bacterium]MDW8407835.1 AmmeMemoRadiSam system protein B [Anaerolineae bacterium]
MNERRALPRLRPIDLRAVHHEGELRYWLRDPLQLCEDVLIVPPILAAALAFCDGTRDAEGICAAFALQYGQRLPVRVVQQMLQALDQALLLDNERSALAQAQALEAYRQATFRQPICAGNSYPNGARALKEALNEFFGTIDDTAPAIQAKRGIVSPHIDYLRGGRVYAQAWQAAAHLVQEAELAVIIGTDHYGDDPFTLTRQHYATPYGVLPTARPIVEALAEAIGPAHAFAGELRHRIEHSLELPLVWLHHLRNGQPIEVVPVLAGSFTRFMSNGAKPTDDAGVRSFIDALIQLTAGRRAIFIASGDLAHVGPAFGGAPLNAEDRAQITQEDTKLIEAMQAGNAEDFFTTIRRIDNRNNVCGTAPIYLTLKALEAAQGDIAGHARSYAHCPADEEGTSIVSICGIVLD